MRLNSVYARFYRSLNYDFIRASSEGYVPDPWDATPAGDYPFVRIRLRPGITTVVGANESGKSQVLRAIEAALTGKGFDRSDFCRYSRFFGVDSKLVLPEFGALFSDLTEDDVIKVAELSGLDSIIDVKQVAFFRMNESPEFRMYVRSSSEWSAAVTVNSPGFVDLGVPAPFTIDADVPLPDSVPIEYLVSGKPVAGGGRELLRAILDSTEADWFESDAVVQSNAPKISGRFKRREATEAELKTYSLAADLLTTVAGVQQPLFAELQKAVKKKNGYASSIVDTINHELEAALNFPNWWSQDSHFQLFVALFEFDLVFMIRDRTGRSYSFDERSEGLKYFLSYFVQYLAHGSRADGRAEILLMDEPDKFLSSSGQQDLLRIFDDFADPQDPARNAVQVVYVTHSPFLIDKNEVDRIRVLEKGDNDEGTRVVTSVAANHYEPLRSAFGSFVAETTFIGNCNLIVEGPSDQVLIAGASRWLKTHGVPVRDRLDLNHITIVPAGGTRHVPYLVYLARGRDVEKPPVVVLLDNDEDGDQAQKDLAAGGAYGVKLLDADLVLQLSQGALVGLTTSNPLGISCIEDLVPLPIAVAAAKAYCEEFAPSIDFGKLKLDLNDVMPQSGKHNPKNLGTLRHLQSAIAKQAHEPKFHLDKVAFARAVTSILIGSTSNQSAVPQGALDLAASNFGLLLSTVAVRQRTAERAESVERISSRINRVKRDFVRTRRGRARREDVLNLIEEIGSQLDHSPESESLRSTMRGWHASFGLDSDSRGQIEDWDALEKAVRGLAYQSVRASSD
jgi:predicted ATPase